MRPTLAASRRTVATFASSPPERAGRGGPPGGAPAAPALEVSELSFSYGTRAALDEVGFAVDTGEFKVLILPYIQILSDKEVAEIRAFVQNGGTVIADLRTAVGGAMTPGLTAKIAKIQAIKARHPKAPA